MHGNTRECDMGGEVGEWVYAWEVGGEFSRWEGVCVDLLVWGVYRREIDSLNKW